MKVKVGDTVYDPNDQPLMVILTTEDRANISNMPPESTKYCACPDTMDRAAVEAFMETKPCEFEEREK